MAPLAQTLALLAMAVATVAIEGVTLDMAKNSFDDQYLSCGASMTQKLPELQNSEFANDRDFKNAWDAARVEWQKQGFDSPPLSPDQAVALMAYKTNGMCLYKRFNEAVRWAGYSRDEYMNNFHFKSLHFLFTTALQTLSNPQQCQDVFWGEERIRSEAQKGTKVRFDAFAPVYLNDVLTPIPAMGTVFKVRTCHAAHIDKFFREPMEQILLIPPFETFKVVEAREEGKRMHITLHSTGNSSNYECTWLRGGSLPRNAPHLGGILLATMAMAVAIGTL